MDWIISVVAPEEYNKNQRFSKHIFPWNDSAIHHSRRLLSSTWLNFYNMETNFLIRLKTSFRQYQGNHTEKISRKYLWKICIFREISRFKYLSNKMARELLFEILAKPLSDELPALEALLGQLKLKTQNQRNSPLGNDSFYISLKT